MGRPTALLLERAELWRDATPEECLRATVEECEAAVRMLDRLEPDVAERALAPQRLPRDTVALLEQPDESPTGTMRSSHDLT